MTVESLLPFVDKGKGFDDPPRVYPSFVDRHSTLIALLFLLNAALMISFAVLVPFLSFYGPFVLFNLGVFVFVLSVASFLIYPDTWVREC